MIDLDRLGSHRSRTFRLLPHLRLAGPEAAVDFVNERGFIYFWPIKDVILPTLWGAVAGDRPVPDAHDDPGMVSWKWKDESLGRNWWYYGKILRRKATFISLEVAPYFYALSENFGSPGEDYIMAYQDGRLSQAARQVYEALLDKGPLDTISLRKEARLLNAKQSAFSRALEDLQADFKILPVGVAEAGAWKYAFRYDITARQMPELPERARTIGEAEARSRLVELYFRSVGAAQARDVVRLFGWPPELARRTLSRLAGSGQLTMGLSHPQAAGEWFALPELARDDGLS
jgi:hypothetical protein